MPAHTTRRNLLILIGVILAAALGIRIWASFSLFWLDEVLTLDWPRQNSYWRLLTAAKHDNNHVLNSMWMKLVGDPPHWFYYRILSIVMGTVAVASMARIGWRRSPIEGVFAAVLGAATYVLIHYASEARGYGPLCGFALLSYLAVGRAIQRPGWGISALFALTAILGVLSHSTYAFAYGGLLAWSCVAPWPTDRQRWREVLRLHLVPILLLALVYFGRIRGMAIGGGPEFELTRVFVNALSHTVGWRWGDWRGELAAGIVIVIALVEIVLRWRDRTEATADRSWTFFGALLVGTPVLIVFVLKPSIIYMRYVVVCVPFLLLLIASLLARSWRSGQLGRIACVAALLFLVVLNGTRTRGLLRAGRGQYLKALRYIEANDPAPALEITGNNDLHVERILNYYRRFIDKPVTYANPRTWRGGPPRWLVQDIQRFAKRPAPGQQLFSDGPWGRYVCVARFHYNSQSGANWYVFEHIGYR